MSSVEAAEPSRNVDMDRQHAVEQVNSLAFNRDHITGEPNGVHPHHDEIRADAHTNGTQLEISILIRIH